MVERKGDSPVYEVKLEGGDDRKRILHRNLLLPCDVLPVTPEQKSRVRNRTRSDTRISKRNYGVL